MICCWKKIFILFCITGLIYIWIHRKDETLVENFLEFNQTNKYKVVMTDDKGNLISNNTLCLGNTCINETDLQQMISNRKYAGFAIDGERTTMPLYEGSWSLHNGQFAQYALDGWDMIYVFRGWKIEIWSDDNYKGTYQVVENKNSDIPVPLNPGISGGVGLNQTSSYRATWIGF